MHQNQDLLQLFAHWVIESEIKAKVLWDNIGISLNFKIFLLSVKVFPFCVQTSQMTSVGLLKLLKDPSQSGFNFHRKWSSLKCLLKIKKNSLVSCTMIGCLVLFVNKVFQFFFHCVLVNFWSNLEHCCFTSKKPKRNCFRQYIKKQRI